MAERMEKSGDPKSAFKKRPRVQIGYDSDVQEEELEYEYEVEPKQIEK